jgi:hypothetical protein
MGYMRISGDTGAGGLTRRSTITIPHEATTTTGVANNGMPLIAGAALSSSVTVTEVTSTRLTFTTGGDHPFAGTISFTSSNMANGQALFGISVDADFQNGPMECFNRLAFNQFGSAFEDAVWNNLLDAVEQRCR